MVGQSICSPVWISLGEHLSACFVAAGVLETENEEDRDAIRKAKVLYNSCMNESKARGIFETLQALS